MKKSIITKILLCLIIVVLVFSIVACSKPQVTPNEKDDPTDTPEETVNYVTTAKLVQVLNGVDHYFTTVESIDGELHCDLNLAFKFNDIEFTANVKANIYPITDTEETFDECLDNEVAIQIVNVTDSTDINIYLKNGEILLDQGLTANSGKSMFSRLDGVGLSRMLSEAVSYIDVEELSLDSMITDINKLATIVDGAIRTTELLTYVETPEKLTINIQTAGIGDLLNDEAIMDLINGDGEESIIDKYKDVLNFAFDTLFGISLDDLQAGGTIDAGKIPTITLAIDKKTVTESTFDVEGIQFTYVGDLNGIDGDETLSLGVNGTIDNDTAVDCDLPASTTAFEEGYIEATVSLDLGLKDLGLVATVFVDPNFDGLNEGIFPTGYVTVVDNSANELGVIDALFDGSYIYFDIAGMFDMLGIDSLTQDQIENYEIESLESLPTCYKIDIAGMFANDEEVEEPQYSSEDEGTPPPFVLTQDWLTVTLGKAGEFIKFLNDVIENESITIDVATVLDFVDGYLYIPEQEDVNGVWVASDEKYGAEEIAADLNQLISQEMIYAITGLNKGFDELIADDNDDVKLYIGFLGENQLGLQANLKDGNNTIVDVSLEFNIVDEETYEEGLFTAGDFEGAVDLFDMESNNMDNLMISLDIFLNAYLEYNQIAE